MFIYAFIYKNLYTLQILQTSYTNKIKHNKHKN